ATYFNTPERHELVLAFLQTAERSKDLRQQHFLGISYEVGKQFDRIAAFSPLELSAILDCKPEFANNMREYMAVVADFEQNHQQKLVDFDKALKALRITPKYQAASSRNRIFDENDLRREYIDGGKAFAFAKNGDKTNGDRLKQAMTNAIETIAPAVKYSLSPKEFWQERDDLAFIVRPKIEQMLQKELGVAAQHIQVKTLYQAYKDDPTAFDGLSSRSATSGFYSANDNSITMIADAFIKRPELAIWTAYHELGHRGVAVQGYELWAGWLNAARKNDTVRAIADNIQTFYASKGLVLSDFQATEEALVEVFAAYKTQKWDFLAQRHNVEIPQDFRKPQGTAERLWQTAKQRIGQIFGRQPEKLPDSAVFAMLGKLEQSLYQYPEWKQVLERTTEQRNPFIRPTLSGSPRVNPTALANRYRSGGLRFDLNTAEESEFAKAVDDIANGGSASKKHITLGTTPEVLAMIGLPETRINIRVDTIQKAMGEHLNLQDHSHSHIHNLTPETLKQIPEQLNNPIAAMKSAQSSSNPNGFVVLTELTETDSKTGKDKPVVAILDLHPTNQGLEVITVRSVYGRSLMQVEKGLTNDLLYLHTTKGSQFVKDFGLRLPSDALSTANLVRHNVKTNEDLLQYRKDKEMQKIEERYYQNTPKDAMPYSEFVALWEEKNTGEKIVDDALKFMHRQQSLETMKNSFEFENVRNIYSELHQHRLLLTDQTQITVVAPFEWTKDLAAERFNDNVAAVKLAVENEQYRNLLPEIVAKFEEQKQKTANFFGIEKSQVAEFLGYTEPKELLEQAQQIINQNTPENSVKHDLNTPEKESTMNETEKQALAQAFKALELPDRKYVIKGSLVEFQDRPESEIVAALGWDKVATALKDYVNSQSEENAEKLRNAYMVYPFYNELANKGIRDDSTLRNQYAEVIESKFSSFNERRTAALFILQSMWRGRGNSTDITRSYNIEAMTAYIARGRGLRSGWRLENRVNEDFLTKNSIFTHKNLREMGLDSDDKSFDEIRRTLSNPIHLSPDEFASAVSYVILASGFSQKTAKRIHKIIMQKMPANAGDLLKVFNNKNKVNAICK
ncbi:MAG: hypothetical protein IKX14_00150, partial [Neisseriaceae bacterium]|nr:hypothetical protein [Neisseriaceae bacterium]